MSLTPEQTAIRDGKLLLAQTFPIGGSLWNASQTTGATPSSAGTTTALGAVRLWVRKVQPTRLEMALAGADTPRARWQGMGELGAAASPATYRADALTTGVTLTSQDEASYVFFITDVDLDAGYVGVILERR